MDIMNTKRALLFELYPKMFLKIYFLKVAQSQKAFNLWAGKSHPPFLARMFYPGVFYFENLNFGALFHLKKVRQNSNIQNATLQDRKFGPKMEDEIFYGQKSNTFRD